MRQKVFICLGLVFATVTVYWQLANSDFTGFDDPDYVINNEIVKKGVSLKAISLAFKAEVASNWHPVTLLSHMLDCQLFGLNPHAHHLVNLFIHVLNALLLFHLLHKMTRALWPSAIVAALFALHPLHVESVAWISERKDVLSTFFGLLTIWAYWRYVESQKKIPSYLLALIFFALGLMSKPMVVTLPFVLLLLDFWPLNRFGLKSKSGNQEGGKPSWIPRLLIEKIPFFALTIASSIITFLVQGHAGAVMSTELLKVSERIFNALTSYAGYLGKTFWPAELAVFYPLPDAWTVWQVGSAAFWLIAVSAFVMWQIRHRPFLAVGWFWFLGTLIPVIGMVQVGIQSMADRYSYIPLIGVFVMIVWLGKEFFAKLPRIFSAMVTAVVLLACSIVTFFQVQHWKTTESLFRHTIAVTGPNSIAQYALGNALMKAGNTTEALNHYRQAISIKPDYVEAYCQIAKLMEVEGRFQEALNNYRQALTYRPDYAVAYFQIAHLLEAQGKFREAFDYYSQGLRHKPDLHEGLNNFAWLLATCPDNSIRNGIEAVRHAERACGLTYDEKTTYIGTLAAAYAEAGRFPDAIRTAEKARELALNNGETNLAEINSQFLELYRSRHSVHWLMSQ